MKVSVTMKKERKNSKISSNSLDFIRDNVLSITDVTRKNRLSQILDSYANADDSREVFIIRNERNKAAAGVLLDLDFFAYLLKLQELFDNMADQHMLEIAWERRNDIADIDPADVIEEKFTLNGIMAQAESLDIDED